MVRLIRNLRDELTLSDFSDSQLLASIQGIRRDIEQHPGGFSWEGHVAPVFAVVDECIRRRLGIWRLFENPGYFSFIEEILQSEDLKSMPSQLSPDEMLVAKGLAQIREAGPGRFGRDLSFPAEFYQAALRMDAAGVLRFQPTDEQLLAGLLLFNGKIVEMQAGEGKTISIAFVAVMYAVLGRSVHAVTANDYLADRDCRLLAPVYRSLGISSGVIMEQSDHQERQDAYQCDIVYGTLREFGFDFLRDNLACYKTDRVQRQLDVAVVDEADQALIDEASTPLIISGEPVSNTPSLERVNSAVADMEIAQAAVGQDYLSELDTLTPGSLSFAVLLCQASMALPGNLEVRKLGQLYPHSYRRGMGRIYSEGLDSPDEAWTKDLFYIVDPQERFVTLTAKGIEFLEARLGNFCGVDGEPSSIPPEQHLQSRRNARRLELANQVYQSLRARILLEKGVDYLVTEGSVVLLDRYTGRFRPDSAYLDGLQAAVEAREKVTIHPGSVGMAQISVQGFAALYRSLSGITGTATPATEEFERLYNLTPVAVPTSSPQRRVALPCRLYANEDQQLAALVRRVAWRQRLGCPTLVGVRSVGQAAKVSRLLADAQIGHQVLSAVESREEPEIVRKAGCFGAVTVATNIAGRGTDIVLDPDLDRRVVARYVELITSALRGEYSQVTAVCYTEEETNILLSALSESADLKAHRLDGSDAFELAVSLKDVEPGGKLGKDANKRLEFGLGLHVISTEFNRFPRVATQLNGRSGRQGSFGSTLSLLSMEDPYLFPLHRNFTVHRNFTALNQSRIPGHTEMAYASGKAIEKHVARMEAEAEYEAALRRSVAYDYGAVSDAHAAEYYRRRQRLLSGGWDLKEMPSLAKQSAARLVNRHFPMLDAGDYDLRFANLARHVFSSYGLNISEMRGLALDNLSEGLSHYLVQRVEHLQRHLPAQEFDELVKQLLLECCDEAWRAHRENLRQGISGAMAGTYGHKSAVADYIIHAADQWDQFQESASDLFLSRLLTMPASVPSEKRGVAAGSASSHSEIAQLLLQPENDKTDRAEIAA